MKMRRGATGNKRNGRLTQLRLVIEPLEARRLLAGIQVSVYIDQDHSRDFDPVADAPAADRLVYVDMNRNGSFDPGEPQATTDADGMAFFDQLAPGDYAVGLLTNPSSQLQSEPSSIAPAATVASSSRAERLLTNADLSYVWSVDSRGDITRLGTPAEQELISLRGNVVTAAKTGGNTAWLVFNSEQGQQIGQFDLQSGELAVSSLTGLAGPETLLELTAAGGSLVALLSTPQGNQLARVDEVSGGLQLRQGRTATTATQLVGGGAPDIVVAVSGPANARTIRLLDVAEGFAEQASLPAYGDLREVELAADGSLLLVSRDSGVHAFRLDATGLNPAAVMAEAAAPISADSLDGRIVTSNRDDPRELIVWDTDSWLPIGRSSLTDPAQQLVGSSLGHLVFGLGDNGVSSLALTVAVPQSVSLADQSSVALVQLGVQKIRVNSAPLPVEQVQRVTLEDESDSFHPDDLGIVDPDGDELWFSVVTQAKHGHVSLGEGGVWIYTPDPNFEGTDFATLLAHDGQERMEFRLEWVVEPVNDPPLSISVETIPIPEDSPWGTEVGQVSVIDVDSHADYIITSSDPRFTIQNGRIYLTSGSIDFESEASIVIEVLAVDSTMPEHRIGTQVTLQIEDVNEPPVEIRLSGTSVNENEPGAVIGEVGVVDPDGWQDYRFDLSDGRFEVVESQLKLKDGEQLDFETEPFIALTITAIDQTPQGYSISTHVTLTVNDQNDPPLDILLSGREVEQFQFGSVVGLVTVVDPDDDEYEISVSDSRFEVVDQTLKLRDDVQLEEPTDSSLILTLTAAARNGDRISDSFAIRVVPARSPWQNPRMPEDVNNDGRVTPLDVLIIINILNAQGSHRLPAPPTSGTGEPILIWPDVTGDGLVTPLDALRIINVLNERSQGEGEEDAAPDLAEPGFPGHGRFASGGESEWERQKRVNSEIDAELELLLDQLSREKNR
jgi:hypothetical protein